MESQGWEPKIVAFLCNWCSYAGADLAGTSRIQYPANVRIIRVPCSGRLNPFFILASLQHGIDRSRNILDVSEHEVLTIRFICHIHPRILFP